MKPEELKNPAIEFEDLEDVALELDELNNGILRALDRCGELLVNVYQKVHEKHGVPYFLRWCHQRLGITEQTAVRRMRLFAIFGRDAGFSATLLNIPYAAVMVMCDPSIGMDTCDVFKTICREAGRMDEEKSLTLAREGQTKREAALDSVRSHWEQMSKTDKHKFLILLKRWVSTQGGGYVDNLLVDRKILKERGYTKAAVRESKAEKWRRRNIERGDWLAPLFGPNSKRKPLYRP